MVRAVLLALLVSAVGLLVPSVAAATEDGGSACKVIAADIQSARERGDTSVLSGLFASAMADTSGCDEHAKHCLGDMLALGQLDAAYFAADGGATIEEILALANAGLAFGSPWQLEAGLGDFLLERGRSRSDGATYSQSAVHFQQALIALMEPQVCAEFGEPPRPAVGEIELLYNKLSATILLAQPLEVVTTKCAVCQWLFLSGAGGFEPKTRPLPIGFASGSAEPTAQGIDAIKALVECLKARHATGVVLSGHTDRVGTAEHNLRLSERRLERVTALLVEGGFSGEIALVPRGEAEPFPSTDGEFSEADTLRLSRRIELVALSADQEANCS